MLIMLKLGRVNIHDITPFYLYIGRRFYLKLQTLEGIKIYFNDRLIIGKQFKHLQEI